MRSILKTTIALCLLTGFVSCQQDNSSTNDQQERIDPSIVNNPASADASSAEENSGVPVIEFDKTRHHFGVIQSGEKVTYSFAFKNTGTAPLLISSAKATCGCTVPDYTREPVNPGEEGNIDVTFDSSGKSGMESKNITIISNTTPNSTILTISAEILKETE